MNSTIIRHKSSFTEFVQVFGLFMVTLFSIPLIYILSPLGRMLDLNLVWPLSLGCAISVAALYICDLRRLDRERLISLNEEGIEYHAFSNDIRKMRWNDITKVHYVTRIRHGYAGLQSGGFLVFAAPGVSFKVCRSHLFSFGDGPMSFFSRGYFVNDKGCMLLLALLKSKLGDKLICDSELDMRSSPKSLRQAAQLLLSWGDYAQAEEAMRDSLYYAPALDKKNFPEYLDEYAAILRKLGRSIEAAEIESRSLESLKGLTHLKENVLQVLN